jgi:hypothetical protein
MKLKSSSTFLLRIQFGTYGQTPTNCHHESTGTDIKYYDNHKGHPQYSTTNCVTFHNAVCTVHVLQVAVYSWSNTMHLLIQPSYILTCYGGGNHRQQRTQHHRSKHTATGRCLSSHAHIAIFWVPLQHTSHVCWNIAWLYTYMHSVGPTCRQELCHVRYDTIQSMSRCSVYIRSTASSLEHQL